MELYNSFAVIIVLAAVFGYINFRFIKLPNTIGVMIISLVGSLGMIGLGKLYPNLFQETLKVIKSLDFYTVLMKIMLSFLLFAGSIHINVKEMRKERTSIITFSTIGVLLSTVIVASLSYFVCHIFGLPISFIYCLLFGALISPTDPIAVLEILKNANIPKSLEMKISGESLFNDGIAVVIFLTILEAMRLGVDKLTFVNVLLLFLREAGGGLLFGFLLGYVAYAALRTIDNYKVEVMITLAVVMGGYMFADYIHISGPLTMVIAGIFIGNKGRRLGMSEVTRDYVDKFWEMVDEALNAMLFLLIGMEMLVINFSTSYLWIGMCAIAIVLVSRYISVSIPIAILKYKSNIEKNAISILTWSGVRGGISVALALSLPYSSESELIVSITYIIVLFSIIVQGLTVGKVVKRLM
ncbi:MAG TPA: sodium:proton antiporter [Arachidicoccus soli]|uniref:Sodium:proton antiporter n=1 Tax=Arachidicoccus soli TaxID=2341117 RepID=A0A386HTA0_9BACT|nr:sodium:proton antiporter [Arachidicoccus soli]AYD48691.1 sodium:proton antiporter [Arachidicoccus soli]HEU0228849.1 sodium:proton antiporter [Arachidicoccus soli]